MQQFQISHHIFNYLYCLFGRFGVFGTIFAVKKSEIKEKQYGKIH
jgi:hypothetical protein